jgi:multidrug efflux system outer membrane protein
MTFQVGVADCINSPVSCHRAWRSGKCGRLATLVAAVVLGLAGCSVGPDYERPKTETPAAWLGPGQDQAAWPSAEWWRGFGSAQLDEFIAEAERANYDFAAAVERVRQADAQVRISGAALLPTIDASGGAERIHTPGLFGTSLGGGGQSGTSLNSVGRTGPAMFNVFSAGVTASYEIDFWGKNHDALAAAQASARASRYDAGVVYLSVVSNTAITYFQAVGLQDQLAVARDNLKTGEDLLEVLRAQLEHRRRPDPASCPRPAGHPDREDRADLPGGRGQDPRGHSRARTRAHRRQYRPAGAGL